jgi:hypothetical protein
MGVGHLHKLKILNRGGGRTGKTEAGHEGDAAAKSDELKEFTAIAGGRHDDILRWRPIRANRDKTGRPGYSFPNCFSLGRE